MRNARTKSKPAKSATAAKPIPTVWSPTMQKVLDALEFCLNPENELEGLSHEGAIRFMDRDIRTRIALLDCASRANDPESFRREERKGYRRMLRYVENIAVKSSVKLPRVKPFATRALIIEVAEE